MNGRRCTIIKWKTLKLMLVLLIYLGPGSSGYAQKQSADELLKKALHETNVKANYPQAISLARNGLLLSPNYVDIHLLLGRLYMLTGNYPEARKELGWVLKRQPRNMDALNYLINLEATAGDFGQAIKYADNTLRYKPGDRNLLIKKASLLEAANRFVDAYEIIDGLLKQQAADSGLKTMSATLHLAAGREALREGRLDTARNEFLSVLRTSPGDTNALNYLVNLEAGRNNHAAALQYANMALEHHPESPGLLMKKTGLLDNLGELPAAYAIAQPLSAQYPGDTKIKLVANDLYIRTRKNRVGVSINYTGFERQGRQPWRLVSAYYQRQGKSGVLLARVNYADRSYDDGFQLEVEGYPKHGKRSYSFFNLAYSPSAVFPKYRLAYSLFTTFSRSWEAELGVRYQYNEQDFMSYGGSIARYFSRYWINFRAFVTPESEVLSQSYTLTSRYYLPGTESYITLIGGTGVSPDDRTRNFQFSERVRLRSARLSAGFQKDIRRGNIIGVLATWNRQEYVPGRRENEYDIFISFQHFF